MVKELTKVENSISVENLIKNLNEWGINYEILDGCDAKFLSEQLGVYYPWNTNRIGPSKYEPYSIGDEITHFLTVGGDLLVWAIRGTSLTIEDEPDYDLEDPAVRIK